MEDFKADLAEWKRLLQATQRPGVQEIINREIAVLEARAEAPVQLEGLPTPIATPPSTTSSVLFTSIQSFAWDQDDKNVTVYITLNGVHTLPKEAVTVEFGKQSVELKVFNLEGRNYALHIKKLGKPINSNESTIKIKKDAITMKLRKAASQWWPDLNFKESVLKKKPTPRSDDPSSSIMELMKDLYEGGDDDMKRTIAQAWTNAQDNRDKEKDIL